MKILFIHNDYALYSGEESVIDDISMSFKKHGHDICFYRKTSAGHREKALGKVYGFFCGIYSFEGIHALRRKLKSERPDVVNIHNLYPFISPAALQECRRAGVPVVMTVHNYRLMCPTGLFMRNGAPCELCLKSGNEWNCIRYNCEHSFSKSLGYALRNMFARRMKYYHECVDIFVCLTEFQKKKLVEAGFDPEKIKVIPNGINIIPSSEIETGGYVAYAGRLSEEKGYDLLLEVAHRHPEIPFHFAGGQRDGHNHLPENVRLYGHLNKRELAEFIKKSQFLVIPSRCYEGFPISALEAMVQGKAVIGPHHGAFSEIIGIGDSSIGKLFIPGNADSLEQTILELWNRPEETERLGYNAYEKAGRKYDSERIFKQWESLFMSFY